MLDNSKRMQGTILQTAKQGHLCCPPGRPPILAKHKQPAVVAPTTARIAWERGLKGRGLTGGGATGLPIKDATEGVNGICR